MATRERLLDEAERLFAGRSFEGVSIREITERARANVAAVSYHFGSKLGLLRAVTDRVVEPLNARRRVLLEDALASGRPTVADLLDAFIRPDIETIVELGDRGPAAARFLGRVYSSRAPEVQRMALEQFGPTARRFRDELAKRLPALDDDELRWRIDQVVALIVHTFSTFPERGLDPEQADYTVRRMVSFLEPAISSLPAARADAVPRARRPSHDEDAR